MSPVAADKVLCDEPDAWPSSIVFMAIHAADVRVPIAVDLSETAGHVLARVLRGLGLEEVISEQRVSFFLLHNGFLLEMNESLADAGVAENDQFELGLYTFLIE
jgi:hypothetical protein